MRLSLKAIRFVIEALEHYQKFQDRRLSEEGLSEDDASDLVNDRHYLKEIQKDFETYRDELLKQRENVQTEA